MPPIQFTIEFLVAASAALVCLVLLVRVWMISRRQRARFAQIVSVDEEVARLRRECDALESGRRNLDSDLASRKAEVEREHGRARSEHERQVVALQESYSSAKATHDRLLAEIRRLEEDLEHIDVGLYRPHFNFDDSEAYKRAVMACRDEIKHSIKQDIAIVWGAAWTVQGSAKEGQRMQKQYGNLMLRAFNGECEAAIASVSWNNVTKLEARLQKDFAAINKLGTVMRVDLSGQYLDLRLKELRLVYEHARKKQEEVEEQRRIREQMREEERVLRELEKAKQEAEADERRYQRALERARQEAALAKGVELDELNQRVQELEQSLREAHARGERATSQAQMTKSGHVYVISNVGSFGNDVFKIGMTRRLEPLDRVKELGDASVPFGFDVHAMIYAEDAPALEAAFHREFAGTRINLVNDRKEFFRVDLAAIATFAESRGLKVELTLVAAAQEFRETLALRTGPAQPPQCSSPFPAAL